MKKIIVSLLFIGSFLGILKAQETPPTTLKAVNAQFYINLADSAIWHNKGRAPDGSNYGWERLARYSEVYAKAASDARYIRNQTSSPEAKNFYVNSGAVDDYMLGGYFIGNKNLSSIAGGLISGSQIAFGKNTASNSFAIMGANYKIANISTSGLSASRTYALPNSDGTFAITSDLAVYKLASDSINTISGYASRGLLTNQLALKENQTNKTATQSSSTTTYPNWLGVTNALSSFGTGFIPNNNTATASSGYAFYVSGNGQVGGTFKVGSYVSTASTGISVSQLVTTANNHGIEIARVINPSSASGGVAEFDARTQSLGTFDIDHFVSYQARGKWSSSANTNNMNGLWVLDEMDGSGIVYSRNGVRIEDINKSGVGDLQNNIGLYVAPQLNGSLTNYNIVSSGGRNAFTGKVKIGSGGATNPTENLYVIGDTYLDGAVTTATGFRSSLFSGSKIVTTSGTSIVEGATGTGVITALGVNTGAVGAFVVNGGALGTPSSGTITNLSGTCASCTIGGSAATLTTTRTIWGQNFNGSANVSGAITGATSITANGIVTGVNLFATTTGGNPEVRLTPVTTGTSIISLLNVAGSSPIIGYQGVLRMGTVTGGAGAGTVNTMTLDASNNVNVTNALTVGTGATLTTSPTTSAGGYEILTRNTSTGLVEKITSTSVTANPMTTSQDIIVGGASGTPTRLAKGSNGSFLSVNTSGNIAWANTASSLSINGTAGNGYLDLFPQTSIPSAPSTSVRLFDNGGGQLPSFIQPNGIYMSLNLSGLTANRILTAPDKSGTIALLSDIGTTTVDASAASYTLASGSRYITSRATLVTFTLPVTATLGQIFIITGGPDGTGLWKVAQNSGQTIHGATNTTTGTGGSVTATGQYNSLQLVCTKANTDFTVQSSQGSLTIL